MLATAGHHSPCDPCTLHLAHPRMATEEAFDGIDSRIGYRHEEPHNLIGWLHCGGLNALLLGNDGVGNGENRNNDSRRYHIY